MTAHEELCRALTAERFGKPVREHKPERRIAPLATILDLLAEFGGDDTTELTVARDAS